MTENLNIDRYSNKVYPMAIFRRPCFRWSCSMISFLHYRKGYFSSRWLRNLFLSLVAIEVRNVTLLYYKFTWNTQITQFHFIPITGIGLELVKQFLALPTPPRNIFATYRSKERSGRKTFLENLKKQMIFVGELLELAGTTPALQPLQLDVTDTSSYSGIVDQVIPSNNI